MDRKDYNKFCTCVKKMYLCALKFVVQCNKVGSVEKIMKKEEGQCARHPAYTHIEMVVHVKGVSDAAPFFTLFNTTNFVAQK